MEIGLASSLQFERERTAWKSEENICWLVSDILTVLVVSKPGFQIPHLQLSGPHNSTPIKTQNTNSFTITNTNTAILQA